MTRAIGVLAAIAIAAVCGSATPAAAQETKLRIIAFGAHPDDNELRLGGTAAKWAALGHAVGGVAVVALRALTPCTHEGPRERQGRLALAVQRGLGEQERLDQLRVVHGQVERGIA